MDNEIKILFFGDIVGRCGRNAVISYIRELKQNNTAPDFIIANGENVSHGFGLTEKNYHELLDAGIDCITSGNHIWDKKDIFGYIDDAKNLIRPINYPQGTVGKGSCILEKNNKKLGVINALGRVFMQPIDSAWDIIKSEIERMKQITPNILIDFHAEASAEKICFGRYASELGASLFVGTHTHVQTADEKIINNMAYITDVGFCGAYDSVIGMEYQTSLKRLLTLMPERYEVVSDAQAQINAIEVSIVDGNAIDIKRLNFLEDSKKELEDNVEISV